jgi:hypothetical protein
MRNLTPVMPALTGRHMDALHPCRAWRDHRRFSVPLLLFVMFLFF